MQIVEERSSRNYVLLEVLDLQVFQRKSLTPNHPGMYSSVVNNIPWTKSDERGLSADGLTIYCGNDAFTPTGSDNGYMDMTTGYIFTGFDHNGADNAHLLVANAATFSHDYTQNPLNDQKDFQVIVLSDTVLVTGSVQDNTLGTLSSLQEIYDKGALYPGRTITNVGYQSMLSFTLLHELFHAAESDTSKSHCSTLLELG